MRSENRITNFVVKDGKRVVEGQYELSQMPVIEFNTLTMVGASLLNRDDSGHQKTIAVGGVPRMRVSSQCKKRAYRKEICGDAVNTRRPTYVVRTHLADLCLDEEQLEIVDEAVLYILSDTQDDENKSKKTKKAYMFSEDELLSLSDFIRTNLDAILTTEKKLKESDKKTKKNEEPQWYYDFDSSIKKETENFKVSLTMDIPMSSEVALCGRMETSGVVHETDSAVCLNHSMSVDPFQNEYDFFCANEDVKIFDVEEKRWGTNQESAIPGTSDINSNTLYDYSSVHIYTLIQNLSVGRDISNPDVQQWIKEEAARMATEWAKAVVQTKPTAKQTSAATFTRPDLIFVTIGNRVSNWSYENAYCKPVFGDYGKGVMEQAIDRLADYLEEDMANFNEYTGRYWVESGKNDRKFSDDLGITTDIKYKSVIDKIREVIMAITFERKETSENL